MDSKLVSVIVVLCSLTFPIQCHGAKSANSSAYPHYPDPHYPTPTHCPICNTLHTGFTTSQTEFTSITTSLSTLSTMIPPCPSTASSDIVVAVSRETTVADDSVEFVACPSGYFPLNCRCSARSNLCEGGVATTTATGCTVRNSPGGGTVRAIATCIRDLGRFFVGTTNGLRQAPLAFCPSNSRMIECGLENRGTNQGAITTVIVGNQCSASGPCTDSTTLGCRVVAICERLS